MISTNIVDDFNDVFIIIAVIYQTIQSALLFNLTLKKEIYIFLTPSTSSFKLNYKLGRRNVEIQVRQKRT